MVRSTAATAAGPRVVGQPAGPSVLGEGEGVEVAEDIVEVKAAVDEERVEAGMVGGTVGRPRGQPSATSPA